MTEETPPQKQCPLHSGLAQSVKEHERRLGEVDDDIGNIYQMVQQIRDRLLGRPQWLVVALLSAMATMIGVLATMYFGIPGGG